MTEELTFQKIMESLTSGDWKTALGYTLLFLMLMFKSEVVKFFTSKKYDLRKFSKVNSEVVQLLNQIKRELQGTRVTFYQFKNGSHYFSHQPVIQLLPTHVDADTIYDRENFSNLTHLIDILSEHLNDRSIVVKVEDTKYKSYALYLSWLAVNGAVLFPVVRHKQIVGVVEVIDPQTNRYYQGEGYVTVLSQVL